MWHLLLALMVGQSVVATQSADRINHEEFFTVRQDYPKIMIAINARNAAVLLPWFLGQLENLDYPKEQLVLHIRSDHNQDNTHELLQKWIDEVSSLYAHVDYKHSGSEKTYADEKGPFDWSKQRMTRVMQLKQEALDIARNNREIEYLFLLDTDAMLMEPRVLRELVTWQKPVIAPMLTVLNSNYSNFWAAIDRNGYYLDSPNYYPIVSYQNQGCHHVAMVHSALLIDVRDPRAKLLAFSPDHLPEYHMALDDLLVFGESTDLAGMEMYVLNTAFYGYILEPQDDWHGVLDLAESVRLISPIYITYLVAELVDQKVGSLPLLYSPIIQPQWPESRDTLGLDCIYVINLQRRPERKYRMDYLFEILGLDVTYWPAVDGQLLNDSVLASKGIKLMPNYEDPYFKRPMKYGEIGCFLSHYGIWKDVVEHKYDQVLVLEDDVRFKIYFRYRVLQLLRQLTANELQWDLIYMGRKYMGWRYPDDERLDEAMIKGFSELTLVDYSYWTVGYLLSGRGAQRLVDGKPLDNLVPVDEYLPIMYNRQPHTEWLEPYKHVTHIKAFGVWPEFIAPSHYTYQSGYVTDTEASPVASVDASVDRMPGPPADSNNLMPDSHTEL